MRKEKRTSITGAGVTTLNAYLHQDPATSASQREKRRYSDYLRMAASQDSRRLAGVVVKAPDSRLSMREFLLLLMHTTRGLDDPDVKVIFPNGVTAGGIKIPMSGRVSTNEVLPLMDGLVPDFFVLDKPFPDKAPKSGENYRSLVAPARVPCPKQTMLENIRSKKPGFEWARVRMQWPASFDIAFGVATIVRKTPPPREQFMQAIGKSPDTLERLTGAFRAIKEDILRSANPAIADRPLAFDNAVAAWRDKLKPIHNRMMEAVKAQKAAVSEYRAGLALRDAELKRLWPAYEMKNLTEEAVLKEFGLDAIMSELPSLSDTHTDFEEDNPLEGL